MRSFRKNWRKRNNGTTAIEFSMLAFPFVLMIVGIIEVSLMFTSAVMVEGGTSVASRLIRTCQLQDMTGDPEENFKTAFCSHATVLLNCEEKLHVEAIQMPDESFMNASNYSANFDENGNMISSGFDTGDVSDVVLIRAAYRYELLTPIFSTLMGGVDGTKTFLSTIVLQVEPCEYEEE